MLLVGFLILVYLHMQLLPVTPSPLMGEGRDEGGRGSSEPSSSMPADGAGAGKGEGGGVPPGMEVRDTPRGAALNLNIDIRKDKLTDIYRKAQFLSDTGKELKTLADTLAKTGKGKGKDRGKVNKQNSGSGHKSKSPANQPIASGPANPAQSDSLLEKEGQGRFKNNGPAPFPTEGEMLSQENEMLEALRKLAADPATRPMAEMQAKAQGFATPEEYIAKLEEKIKQKGGS